MTATFSIPSWRLPERTSRMSPRLYWATRRNGIRLNAGGWLDDDQTFGIEAGLLYLNRGSLVASIGNRDGTPLARIIPNSEIVLERQRTFDPTFQNVDHSILAALLVKRLGIPAIDMNRRQVVIPIGDRDLANASMQFDIAAKTFAVFDLLGRAHLAQCDDCRIDGLAGYRRICYSDSTQEFTRRS